MIQDTQTSSQDSNQQTNSQVGSSYDYGSIRTTEDGTTEKLTLNGWERAKYARDWNAPESLIQAIKDKEGLGPNVRIVNGKKLIFPYLDPVGIPTVGYGHVIDKLNDPKYVNGISVEEADRLLRNDVSKTYERRVENLTRVPLTNGEFNALLSSIFNGGTGDSVLNVVNSKNYDAATVFKAFLQRRSAKGEELRGLIIRRAMEAWQYLYGEEPHLNTAETRQWMNAWNNFADAVAPQNKIKQVTNYKK